MKDKIFDDYYNWLINMTTGWCAPHGSYTELMKALYFRDFTYTIERDGNRAEDGKDLRMRFADENQEYTYRDVQLYLDEPCTVLEMMAALADRCERDVMQNIDIGDRTGVWFYDMIKNLKLDGMDDEHFDPMYVESRIDILLNRDYAPNGEGGLFTVNTSADLRTMELWYQMNWYLSEVVDL